MTVGFALTQKKLNKKVIRMHRYRLTASKQTRNRPHSFHFSRGVGGNGAEYSAFERRTAEVLIAICGFFMNLFRRVKKPFASRISPLIPVFRKYFRFNVAGR